MRQKQEPKLVNGKSRHVDESAKKPLGEGKRGKLQLLLSALPGLIEKRFKVWG